MRCVAAENDLQLRIREKGRVLVTIVKLPVSYLPWQLGRPCETLCVVFQCKLFENGQLSTVQDLASEFLMRESELPKLI